MTMPAVAIDAPFPRWDAIAHQKRRAAGDLARDALKSHAVALATGVHRDDPVDPFRDKNLAGRLLLAAFCELTRDKTLEALIDALGDLAVTDPFDYRGCAEAHARVSNAAMQLADEQDAARYVAEDRA